MAKKSERADRTAFAAEADDMSLSNATPDDADEVVPDTLDVRNDSLMVMHGALQRLRRPAIALVVGLAISVATLVAVGALTRSRQIGVDPT